MRSAPRNLIFDFDSTLVRVESLDELAAIALRGKGDTSERTAEIRNITNLGMEGKIPFSESLSRRMALFSATRDDVHELVRLLRASLTESVARNIDFFKTQRDHVYVISSGFREYIAPISEMLGIMDSHIISNTLLFDSGGVITGPDLNNPLMGKRGKSVAVKSLGLLGTIYVVGDGYTDYEVREDGTADIFVAFTENVARPAVIEKADYRAATMEEFLALV